MFFVYTVLFLFFHFSGLRLHSLKCWRASEVIVCWGWWSFSLCPFTYHKPAVPESSSHCTVPVGLLHQLSHSALRSPVENSHSMLGSCCSCIFFFFSLCLSVHCILHLPANKLFHFLICLYWLTCRANCPIPVVLSLLSCSGRPVLYFLSLLYSSNCPLRLLCPVYPVLAVPVHCSTYPVLRSYPCCCVLTVLS